MTELSTDGPIIYLIRHCQAGSPPGPDSQLTDRGRAGAVELGHRLADRGIRRIVSSPYARASQSIQPLAQTLGIPVETDHRLRERQVPFDPNLDWQEYIRPTFFDLDLVLPDGESSRAAIERATAALHKAGAGVTPVALASHGQLLSLLLMSLDRRFGFDTWVAMTTPDIYQLTMIGDAVQIERIWS